MISVKLEEGFVVLLSVVSSAEDALDWSEPVLKVPLSTICKVVGVRVVSPPQVIFAFISASP